MTTVAVGVRIPWRQVPQGAFVVVVSYAREPYTSDPHVAALLNTPDQPEVPLDTLPAGDTVYLAEGAMPGQDFNDLSFEPVVWRRDALETAVRAARARARTEPVVAWVAPLRSHRPLYAPLGLDSLPSDATVVVGRKARWAQEEASFTVIKRHLVDGVQRSTVVPDALAPGQRVWLATRYLDPGAPTDLAGWTFMEVVFTGQVRDDLLFDMWALTEPRIGGSYLNRDRFPRYVPLWQTLAMAAFVMLCGAAILTGNLSGFAFAGILFGSAYLAAWMLQGSPDPYLRREKVDGWHFALSIIAALVSGARAADSSNDRRLLAVGSTGLWAGLAYEDRKIRQRHRDERMARVR